MNKQIARDYITFVDDPRHGKNGDELPVTDQDPLGVEKF